MPAREKQVALEWQNDCEGGPVTLWATNEGVDCILNNLISNALRYTPAGGRVIEQGRPADLASQDGAYQRLVMAAGGI